MQQVPLFEGTAGDVLSSFRRRATLLAHVNCFSDNQDMNVLSVYFCPMKRIQFQILEGHNH